MGPELINPNLNLQWLASKATGKGVEVAVIDSGIDASHPELKARVHRACVVTRKAGGKIAVQETSPKELPDSFGHGTAVAGIISDLAPDVRIVNVKVLDDYNSCTGEVLIAGLRWALEQNIRLLNMSLATSKPIWIPPLFELCEQGFVQNSIIVASRRNFGDLGCPAMFSSVISVDRKDFAEKLSVQYRPRDLIQFDARGTNVRVLGPGGRHTIQTGTSFATPHVCGIVALLLEVFPGLTAAEVKAALKACSDRLSSSEHGAKHRAKPAASAWETKHQGQSIPPQHSNHQTSIFRYMRHLGVRAPLLGKQNEKNGGHHTSTVRRSK